MKIVKVATLAEELKGNLAEDRGLIELKANGYEDDMAEMWTCCFEGDSVETGTATIKEVENFVVSEIKTVRMGVWGRGRLYDSEDVVVYLVDGSWWAVYVEDAEWGV